MPSSNLIKGVVLFSKKSENQSKPLKQDGKYGEGNITSDTRRLVSALAKSEHQEISEDAFKAVQMPLAEAEGARRVGEIFNKKIVFIENSIRKQLDFEGVTIPSLPNTIPVLSLSGRKFSISTFC